MLEDTNINMLGDTSLADYLGAPKSVGERKDTRGTPTLKARR